MIRFFPIILLVWMSPGIRAQQFYAQRVSIAAFQESILRQYHAFDTATRTLTRLQCKPNSGFMELTISRSNKLGLNLIPGDSILFVSSLDSDLFVLYQKSDSLFSACIGPQNDKTVRFLMRAPSLVVLPGSATQARVMVGDSIIFFEASHNLRVLTSTVIEVNQRHTVYATKDGPRNIVASLLNNNVVEVELEQDGLWRNVGIMTTLPEFLTTTSTSFIALSAQSGTYILNTLDLNSTSARVRTTPLPAGFFEPRALGMNKDTAYVLFANGIVRLLHETILSADYLNLNEVEHGSKLLSDGTQMFITGDFRSYSLKIESDYWYRFRNAMSLFSTYGVWLLLALLFLMISLRGLRYRRQLRDVIELGSTGISFVVDKNLRLRRINSRARELFDMDATTPLRRVLKFYCNGDAQRIVESFVASSVAIRGTQTQKLMFNTSSGEREIIFSAQALRSLSGAFDGLVVSGIDITEELERKRLVNWAQLAHDMQTNLSIIKLNAEQLSRGTSPELEEQRLRIVHQASLLLQRVRDIVSIGRDEQLHLSEIDIRTLFLDVVREFDDSSFGDVQFITPQRSIVAKIDRAKMLRALRNAAENALRALHERGGSIEFGVTVSKNELCLFVKDNGFGMDEQTLNNFFRPYFSTYRQFGGTGIGTMIMQRAVEIHGGKIQVETAPEKGTTIMFILPSSLYVHG